MRTLHRAPGSVAVIDGISRIEGSGPVATLGELECRDGWAAARLLLCLAIEDAQTPGARALAAELRSRSSSDEDFAKDVHAFVSRIPFIREKGEIFQSGAITIGRDGGDCDDHFRLAYALGAAGGLRSALGVLHHGVAGVPVEKRGPAHAVALFYVGGGWTFAETTVAACLGENPNDAARRLGLTTERSDIAKEIRIMTEQDLPPVPGGYAARNSAHQVSLDAQALQRLGFLRVDEAAAQRMTDPTFSVLRGAVLAFQLAHGLAPDGLLGPHTRATLAQVLSENAPASAGFEYSTIGALGAPRLTADLTDAFLLGVRDMAARYRARGATAAAEDWLAVWDAESTIRNIPNHAGEPYYGLNQMGLTEQKNAGFTAGKDAWLALSLEEQLPFVDRFYESAAKMGGGPSVFRDAGSLYVANIAPGLIGHARDPSFALYSYRPIAGMPSLHASDAEWAAFNKTHSDPYAENRGLDRQKKGFISVDDMRIAVTSGRGARFIEARDRVRALGAAPASTPPGLPIGNIIASLAFLGVGGALYYGVHQGWL